MTKKVYRVHNWKDYNKSLVERGSLTLWFSEDVIESWTHRTDKKKAGRQKYYGDIAIQCVLTLRQLFRLPLRATEGLMHSMMKVMKLSLKCPDYSTICRRAKKIKVNLGVIQTGKGRHVLVDSTGVRIVGEGEWKKLKHGESRCQVWKKLHISMDADNQTILSGLMTESIRLDGNYLPQLLNEIEGKISQVTGDGAYDKKCCYEAIYKREAKAVIPPQHNACKQRNKIKKNPALLIRDKVVEEIGRGRDSQAKRREWKRSNEYHRRSLIETMMFRMKSIFGDEMRARTFENQQTDLLIRCYAINKINTLGLPRSEAI
jgi:hypothetical protein